MGSLALSVWAALIASGWLNAVTVWCARRWCFVGLRGSGGFNCGIKDGGGRLLEGLVVVSSSLSVRIRLTEVGRAGFGLTSRLRWAGIDCANSVGGTLFRESGVTVSANEDIDGESGYRSRQIWADSSKGDTGAEPSTAENLLTRVASSRWSRIRQIPGKTFNRPESDSGINTDFRRLVDWHCSQYLVFSCSGGCPRSCSRVDMPIC